MPSWDGRDYAEVSELQRTLAEQALAELSFRGDERVLDVGCGDGYITDGLTRRVPQGSVVGVDASPKMVEAAVARAAESGSGAVFRIADARELPFSDEFDLVVSFNALHWVSAQQRALSAIARSLRYGGRAVVQMVGASTQPSVEDVSMSVARRDAWRPEFVGFTAPYIHPEPDSYPNVAQLVGLKVESVRTWNVEWDFGSRDEFARWLAVGSTDWTSRLTPERAQEFVSEVAEAYEQVVGTPGLFRFTQMRLDATRS